MKLLPVLSLLCACAAPAQAIEARSVSYYCTTDAAGGVNYDKQNQRWKSANFKPDKPFVLKLKLVGSSREKMFDWSPVSMVNRFEVLTTEAGSNFDRPCRNTKDAKSPVEVWGDGWLFCDFNLTELRFNPSNNRFMTSYLIGYVDGDDNNENTPSISVGVCTKVN